MGTPLEYLFTYICMVNIKNTYYAFNWLPVHSIRRINICIKMKNILVDEQKRQKQQKGFVQTYSLDDGEEVGMGVFWLAALCGEMPVQSIPPSSDYLLDRTWSLSHGPCMSPNTRLQCWSSFFSLSASLPNYLWREYRVSRNRHLSCSCWKLW